MINEKTLILILSIFLFWMAMFHVAPLNYSNRIIGIISLESLFPSSIADTIN